MPPWGSLAVAAGLLAQVAGTRGEPALFTVPQRDGTRPRASPSTAAVSADGRYVAFMSYARLVAADTGDRADIYVLDRQTGIVTLESLGGDRRPLRGDSGHPRLSRDGGYLAFDTAVLADGSGNPSVQVLLRDRALGTTRQVSVRPDGRVPNARAADPAISADGSVIVFSSSATDLVPGNDENGSGLDVYLYVLGAGTLARISVDSGGVQRVHGNSYAPSVSATGRHVAFVSTADLVGSAGTRPTQPRARGPSPPTHIYLRDIDAGITTRVTELAGGVPANGSSWAPAVSPDGRHVAFASVADNLVPGDRNHAADVFLHDRQTRGTILVSRSARRGSANGPSTNPAMAVDGRLIAFESAASDLICATRCAPTVEDINLLSDVFLFERDTGKVSRVSQGPGGWMEESGGPAISGDGTVVAFASRHPIDAEDSRHDFDLYLSVASRSPANLLLLRGFPQRKRDDLGAGR